MSEGGVGTVLEDCDEQVEQQDVGEHHVSGQQDRRQPLARRVHGARFVNPVTCEQTLLSAAINNDCSFHATFAHRVTAPFNLFFVAPLSESNSLKQDEN